MYMFIVCEGDRLARETGSRESGGAHIYIYMNTYHMHVYIHTYIYIHSIKQVLDSQMASRVLRFALHIAILACSVRALPRCARASRAGQMHDVSTRQASHAVARAVRAGAR